MNRAQIEALLNVQPALEYPEDTDRLDLEGDTLMLTAPAFGLGSLYEEGGETFRIEPVAGEYVLDFGWSWSVEEPPSLDELVAAYVAEWQNGHADGTIVGYAVDEFVCGSSDEIAGLHGVSAAFVDRFETALENALVALPPAHPVVDRAQRAAAAAATSVMEAGGTDDEIQRAAVAAAEAAMEENAS